MSWKRARIPKHAYLFDNDKKGSYKLVAELHPCFPLKLCSTYLTRETKSSYPDRRLETEMR